MLRHLGSTLDSRFTRVPLDEALLERGVHLDIQDGLSGHVRKVALPPELFPFLGVHVDDLHGLAKRDFGFSKMF